MSTSPQRAETSGMHAAAIAQHMHEHVYLSALHDDHERRTRWVVALTSVMMVGEIVAGTLFGSMALLADGWHMATHAGALAVAAFAYAYARKRARDARFSFGTGKIGDLAGFASALALGLIALGIGIESVMRFFEPMQVAFSEATLVAALGLIVNIVSAVLLSGPQGHHHEYHDHRHDDHADVGHADHHHDNNLRSAYLHVLADALTSVLAIAALLAGRYLDWTWLDPTMGIVGAIVIARWSWGLMRDTAAVLVDTADPELSAEIRDLIESGGDARIIDLHVWRLGPGKHAAILALVSGDPKDAVVYKARLADVRQLAHITVEVHRCACGQPCGQSRQAA